MRREDAPATSGAPLAELLDLASSPAVLEGERATARDIVRRLRALAPGAGFGLVVHRRRAPSLVYARDADGRAPQTDGLPDRLFPQAEREIVLAISDGASGAHLHCAGRDADEQLARAALPAATSALRGARFFESRGESAETVKDAQLGRMVPELLHELNNPVTSILASVELLQRRLPALGAQPSDFERVDRISSAAGTIQRLSRDLLVFARPTASTAVRIRLEELLSRALELCEHELSSVQVEAPQPAPEPLEVMGVPDELSRVFVNLITNAAQAVSGSGRVRVTATVDEASKNISVEVSDDGPGMPSEVKARIFEPFFTTRVDNGGNGLGLPIVASLVRRHHGTIEVDSELGTGTTVRVTLPRAG